MKSLVVPPVHPAKGGDLDFTDRCPRPVGINQLCFVEPVDRFSQRVVIRVTNGADRRIDTRLGERFTVTDRHILRAAVTVVDKPF